MTTSDIITNDYFNWLCDLVCGDRYSEQISYKKLLMYLHDTPFRYSIPRDGNRAEDGISLRHRFACDYVCIDDADLYLIDPCSVLEMMLALSIRCEEIMDDPNMGDRTTQWFWSMITTLGLGSMTDDLFDKKYVKYVIKRFLDRKYEPDGTGGLFKVRNCSDDLRSIEIWVQMLWYLDNIT